MIQYVNVQNGDIYGGSNTFSNPFLGFMIFLMLRNETVLLSTQNKCPKLLERKYLQFCDCGKKVSLHFILNFMKLCLFYVKYGTR